MVDKNKIFKEYIENFKELSDNDKKNNLIRSLKELIAVIDNLSKESNISLDYIHSNEILDLNKDNVTDSDFLEAAFVYLEIARDLFGQYMMKNGN